MKPTLKVTNQGASIKLDTMLDRGKSMQSFLNRNIYMIYQNAQRTRWATEGASEGKAWDRLSEPYATYKRKRFAAYEGGGTKMLVATNRLFRAVVGPNQGQHKIATNDKLYISTSLLSEGKKPYPYPQAVDEARTFTTWSPAFREKVMKAITDFIQFNIRRES